MYITKTWNIQWNCWCVPRVPLLSPPALTVLCFLAMTKAALNRVDRREETTIAAAALEHGLRRGCCPGGGAC